MKPELSIVIPAYKEVDNLKKCIPALHDALREIPYEIVIVDDNSQDGTEEFVNGYEHKENIRLLVRKNENGFGSAVWRGMKHAQGTCIIVFMADLSDDPKHVLELFSEMRKGYDIVFTTRFKGNNRAYDYPKVKYYCNRLYNQLISLLFGLPYKDTSNAFKAFRKDLVDQLDIKSHGFEITTELALKAYFRGKTFSEIPVTWHNRTAGDQKSRLLKVGMGYARILPSLIAARFKK